MALIWLSRSTRLSVWGKFVLHPWDQVGGRERAAVEATVMAAFVENSDQAWEALLEATGAAHFDDARGTVSAAHRSDCGPNVGG